VKIRDATPADAATACGVLRASITELCVADHRNDPAILGTWLANKTPEIVAGWATQPDSSLLIAVEGGTVLAVGGVKDSGNTREGPAFAVYELTEERFVALQG